MAVLPDRRTQHLKTAALLAVVFALVAGSARAESTEVDLLGTWHVLVHFTDDHTHDPTQLRWDDRVWVFAKAGSRLRWTEYPIVVFRDQSGRFESRGAIRAARALHGWEPNESQRAQITGGVEVSPRGRKQKTLRNRDGDWQSTNRSMAASASIVSYVENWSIRDPSGKPTFRREDVLGSAESESLEGVTQYTTTEVLSGGDELRGTFVRDESRRGSFRMVRSGDTKALSGTRKSEGQRFQQEFLGDRFDLALDREGSAVREAVAVRAGGREGVSKELRARVRGEIASAISERLREAGKDPDDYVREVESLTEQIEAQLIDGGRSPYDVVEMLKDGRIDP
jgi:hypothetical protein